MRAGGRERVRGAARTRQEPAGRAREVIRTSRKRLKLLKFMESVRFASSATTSWRDSFTIAVAAAEDVEELRDAAARVADSPAGRRDARRSSPEKASVRARSGASAGAITGRGGFSHSGDIGRFVSGRSILARGARGEWRIEITQRLFSSLFMSRLGLLYKTCGSLELP